MYVCCNISCILTLRHWLADLVSFVHRSQYPLALEIHQMFYGFLLAYYTVIESGQLLREGSMTAILPCRTANVPSATIYTHPTTSPCTQSPWKVSGRSLLCPVLAGHTQCPAGHCATHLVALPCTRQSRHSHSEGCTLVLSPPHGTVSQLSCPGQYGLNQPALLWPS